MPIDAPESCEQLLCRMIGFNTVNGNLPDGRPDAEQEQGEYLDGIASTWGFDTTRFAVPGHGFNLLIKHEVAPNAPWLLFDSHADTVSVEGMTIDPFAGRIADGRIYGRGACDTKGTGAAMLWALHEYSDGGTKSNNVALCFSVDEEVTKAGVRAFESDQLPGLGFTPAGVIVGEPTMLRLVVAHKGGVRWRLRTRGIAAHSSDPSKGRSAISMMVKVVAALESQYIPNLTVSHPLTGKAQCSINQIHGGVQSNVIPERCEAIVDRRAVPGEDIDQVLAPAERVLDELRGADPNLVVESKALFSDPPLDPAGSEAFASWAGAAMQSLGLDGSPSGVPYGTNGSTFSESGFSVVVLGPGDIAQAHTCDEWIARDQLAGGVEAYRQLMDTTLRTVP